MKTPSKYGLLLSAIVMLTAGTINADPIGRGVQVSGGVIFVLPGDAANNEGGTGNPGTAVDGHVTVTFTGYWTTWSDPSYYGDRDAILAVGVASPGTITLTADEGYEVTLVSLEIVGTDGHGGPLTKITAGPLEWDNVASPEMIGSVPSHTDLIINKKGTGTPNSITLTLQNDDGDYGWDGINYIVFSAAKPHCGTVIFVE